MSGHITPGTVPAMDRPSIVLAKALDGVKVEGDEDGVLHLTCEDCGESICDVEDGDTMRVLFNTALAHVCRT